MVFGVTGQAGCHDRLQGGISLETAVSRQRSAVSHKCISILRTVLEPQAPTRQVMRRVVKNY